MWDAIATHISETTGEPFEILQKQTVGGGCINDAYRLEGRNQNYFVKLNHAGALDMFEAEADGLREIAGTKTIRVPSPICSGPTGAQAYFVMEFINLGGGGSQFQLGERLARLHAGPSLVHFDFFELFLTSEFFTCVWFRHFILQTLLILLDLFQLVDQNLLAFHVEFSFPRPNVFDPFIVFDS